MARTGSYTHAVKGAVDVNGIIGGADPDSVIMEPRCGARGVPYKRLTCGVAKVTCPQCIARLAP